ncbi:hypothetical protein [Ramlibacter sp.]|uniref:hypothetical protein n=1 Tax=Ramlibacter sp. TaxID=1917967 RepID=UPI002ED620F3
MRQSPFHPPHSRLLPEGRRWGFGAHSVLPYLAALLDARAAEAEAAASIRNPVFPQMEKALRELRSRH